MDEATQKVKADFDRIALLSSESSHNDYYLNYLLRQLPHACADALEIGCGTGDFSRLLARRAKRVLALDFSPNMIQLARRRASDYPNIEFQCADATLWDFPVESFDCVASVATLHHLEMKGMLSKMSRALRQGGTLLVLDLFENEGAVDALTSLVAMPVSLSLRLLQTGRLLPPRAVREAWDEHGRTDSYLTLSQVRNICEELLPGAKVRKHLLWRYSIVWKKV
ncbi:MAG: methyltransferase domain-containing protein [Acidobacteria bacterium]|nr:methyltransferase domain-containing protein [Acidobacteriota bacterium]